MSAFEQDIRHAMDRAYRIGMAQGTARAYAGQARSLLRKQFAMDQQQSGPAPESRMREIVGILKAKLSPQEFELAMQLLRGGGEGQNQQKQEDWSADDPPMERPDYLEHMAMRSGAHDRYGMDESRSGFNDMYPDSFRLKQDIVAYQPLASGYGRPGSRRGDDQQLAMDADAARTSFDEMFITGRIQDKH